MLPMYLQPCRIETCETLIGRRGGLGLCNAHYKRNKRGTDMNKPVQRRGEGWLSTHGYKYIGKSAEHRQIMQRKLGRPLGFNEVVHHKDHNPLNNNPDNLEIMSRGDHGRHHNSGKTNEERKQLAGKP